MSIITTKPMRIFILTAALTLVGCASTSKPVAQVSHSGREATLQFSRDSRSMLSRIPTEEAQKSRERLLERKEKTTEILESIAELSLLAGRSDEAAAQARDLLKRDFKNLGALKTLIKVSLFSKRYHEALLLVENGLQMAPKDSDLLNLAGLAHFLMDDVFLARESWKRALAANPQHIPSQMNMSAIYFYNRNLALAGRGFERVLAQQPENVDAKVGRALVVDAQGGSEEARALLQETLKGHRKSSLLLFNLAMIERDRFANYEQALDYLDDYLELVKKERANMEKVVAQREELRLLVAKRKAKKLTDDEIRNLAKRSNQAVQPEEAKQPTVQSVEPVVAPAEPGEREGAPAAQPAVRAPAPKGPAVSPDQNETENSLEDARK
jgi:tetratricopeptide (TPR) repeat protein